VAPLELKTLFPTQKSRTFWLYELITSFGCTHERASRLANEKAMKALLESSRRTYVGSDRSVTASSSARVRRRKR